MDELGANDLIEFVTQPLVLEVFGIVLATVVLNFLVVQFFRRLQKRVA